MSTLPTRSFAAVVQSIAAGVQGRANAILTFAIGSTLRALAEAYAALSMWLQAMILQVLAQTRLATSSGVDADSFVADFGLARLGAQQATGLVRYSRLSASPTAPFIPVGSTLRTADGTLDFAVVADATNPYYQTFPSGYVMPSAVTSINVTVQCSTPGAAGNIQIGALTQQTSALTGIDTVVNPAAFTNGSDGESDQALRARFSAYILGLSRGDAYGLAYAIASLAVNVQYTLTEDYNRDGSYNPGYFYVVADDGSGAPSTAFLATVMTAVQSVRPLAIFADVFAPNLVTASVSGSITTAPGYDHNLVLAQVIATVAANINGLGLGNGLPWSMISSWAYSVPGVVSVATVLLNGASGDAASILADKRNTIKIGTNAWS